MRIFIVEDDEWFSKLMEYHLKQNPDHNISVFHTGKDVLNNIDENPDVVVIDYNLPDIKGDELIQKVTQKINTACIIVSAQEDIEVALDLLKKGAYDYIVKNDNTNERLWHTINRISETNELKEEVVMLQQEVKKKYNFSNLIKGNSKEIKQVFSLMEKASNSSITVSITGETGTGKELAAQAIHYNSDRNKKKFVAVNVAAIPTELLESELFGHEKGAFTGADKQRIGKFEEANKGTIFLDEIGEMDLSIQAKLLRVLQERQVVRVGSNKLIKLDIRIIIATHKNLLDEVQKGNFREDLYYRLYGLPIELPPLRQRGNDILLLAKYFSDEFAKQNGVQKKIITPKAQEKLLNYSFPGNVRELRAAMDLATLMSEGNSINENNINFIGGTSIEGILKKELTLREYETLIIQHFLDKYNRNVIQVAKKLDIGKSTIYRMINNKEIEL